MKFNSGEPELIHSLMISVEEEDGISILPKVQRFMGMNDTKYADIYHKISAYFFIKMLFFFLSFCK